MRDLNVDQIKKLWILDLIIQQGSLKKAALQAKVSPSAVSQTLSALEQSLGKRLLVRHRGSITPTQDALAILGVVRPAFEAFDKLRDLSQKPPPQMSWLNFGTYESIAIDILPGLIHGLKAKMPHLKLGLRISRTPTLLTMVRKGELCSALITEVDELDRFYTQVVTEDRLGIFASKHNDSPELGLGSLAPGKHGLPRYYQKFVRELGSPKVTIASDSFEALRAACSAGSITSILPYRVAMRFDDLVEITPKEVIQGKNCGRHKILVVSQHSCDREEADFLAEETRRYLSPKA